MCKMQAASGLLLINEKGYSKMEFYVSPSGNDSDPGTSDRPFATLDRAKNAVCAFKIHKTEMEVTVFIREGTYYLEEPLVFAPEDSGSKEHPVTYVSYPGEKPVISGGRRLECIWRPYRDGIMMCELSEIRKAGITFDQLFINGKRQVRARYPNYDNSDPGKSGYIYAKTALPNEAANSNPDNDDDMIFSGSAPRGVVFDTETFSHKGWEKPEEAIIHIYQAMYWGNLQWKIKNIDMENNILWFGRGGMQMGAKWHSDPCKLSESSRFFIENVFEELDVPEEWYYDRNKGVLYYMPDVDTDLQAATVEVPILKRVVEFRGNLDEKVEYINLSGIRITCTSATFLDLYDIPSLGDWAIHRGGSVYLENTRNCSIENNYFDAVGGNAVFLNNYNRGTNVHGNTFSQAGDSAVCLVGTQNMTVGSQRLFPFECEISNNLIHDCGVFGKQVAGVFISISKRITVSHNHIYNMPRAGICINDGTWGGHVIEYNRIHDTCRETADHGSFNAWGRDRYWCLLHSHGPKESNPVNHQAGDIFVDQMETVIMRYNFFKEKSGWGLDLDDGASNYHIYNNLCVGISMKLREGAYRLIENNIWVKGANSPCFHVGNTDNHDRYLHNITVMDTKHSKPEHDLNFKMGAHFGEMYTLIKPPFKGPWLEEIDHNLFFSDLGYFKARSVSKESGNDEKRHYTLEEWQKLGFDRHSVYGDPLFVDPENDDYSVRPESPALKLGFVNFDMDRFGLKPDFKDKWT
jgi:hypothetical protein